MFFVKEVTHRIMFVNGSLSVDGHIIDTGRSAYIDISSFTVSNGLSCFLFLACLLFPAILLFVHSIALAYLLGCIFVILLALCLYSRITGWNASERGYSVRIYFRVLKGHHMVDYCNDYSTPYYSFVESDFSDIRGLLWELKKRRDDLALHVIRMCTSRFEDMLDAYDGGPPSADLKKLLIKGLNRIAKSPLPVDLPFSLATGFHERDKSLPEVSAAEPRKIPMVILLEAYREYFKEITFSCFPAVHLYAGPDYDRAVALAREIQDHLSLDIVDAGPGQPTY